MQLNEKLIPYERHLQQKVLEIIWLLMILCINKVDDWNCN